MPKPFLREPFATLENELIRTMIAGLKEWRRDLDYPESHSDMAGCVRAVLRKFDVTLREVPLDRSEIEALPETCPICREEIKSGSHVTDIQRFDETAQTYAHFGCVNMATAEK